ncbi:MAG TPA: OB-fold nucleic acid binding domain-containing protein, partial [Caldilineaceae bacterium]|nr:OB-fold nucleic acid binding domain-containing protein [Caldilineaceae bacterium]
RMGISVLPPDVNYSGLDFEIQDLPADIEPVRGDPMINYRFPVPEGSAIRFGMAAVKQVGEGPVQMILNARNEGGRFKSLEDFADRVDLRKVGKRPLECLIKVGAFDRFGKRSQLLAVLDQMVANSASVHDARASGQLSMFDMLGGDAAAAISAIHLPDIEEVKGREKLTWEKELLGVYAASHPMQNLSVDMSKIVTCYCNELTEEYHDKNVTLAGMISDVRVINTKKGDQMAFVNLEDLQGKCEVVVFPRTYAEIKEKLVADSVVVMKGKAQARNGQTNLLVESIQNYVEQAIAANEEPNQYQRPLLDAVPTINGMALSSDADLLDDGEALDDEDASVMGTLDSVAIDRVAMPMSDEFDSGLSGEENPFANELPAWLADDRPAAEASAAAVSVAEAATATEAEEPSLPKERVAATAVDSPVEALKTEETAANGTATEGRSVEVPSANGKRLNVNGSLASLTIAGLTNDDETTAASHGSHAGDEPSEGQDEEPMSTERSQASVSQANGHSNGNGHQNGNTQANGNGYQNGNRHDNGHRSHSGEGDSRNDGEEMHHDGDRHPRRLQRGRYAGKHIQITFRRSGDLERDKFRLREIFERVRDPRGRDAFCILIESNGRRYELAFPNDPCTVSDRLVSELTKHFRVEVAVEGERPM